MAVAAERIIVKYQMYHNGIAHRPFNDSWFCVIVHREPKKLRKRYKHIEFNFLMMRFVIILVLILKLSYSFLHKLQKTEIGNPYRRQWQMDESRH